MQTDLKIFSALGCYGVSVITVLTVQNSLGTQGIEPVSPDFIDLQLKTVLSDIGCSVSAAIAAWLGRGVGLEQVRAIC